MIRDRGRGYRSILNRRQESKWRRWLLPLVLLAFLLFLVVTTRWRARNQLQIAADLEAVTGAEPSQRRAETQDSENCVLPPGFTREPLTMDTFENKCDKIDDGPCDAPEWAMKEANVVWNDDRLGPLHQALKNMRPENNTIVLITVNYGYAYLFLNWVCSLEVMGLDPRPWTLVVAAESKGAELAEKHNFHTADVTKWIKKKLRPDAQEFGNGDYKYIAALMNLYVFDLINLGYNVLIQDADFTWKRDPRPYLHTHAPKFDIQLVKDSNDKKNFSDKRRNGGFLFYKNNCRTKMYVSSLRNCIPHIFWRRSDQVIMNRLISNYHFNGLKVGMLPAELFVNGHRWANYGKRKGVRNKLPLWPYTYHASWTQDGADKLFKFMVIGQWHFSTCSLYDPELIPVKEAFDFEYRFGTYVRNFPRLQGDINKMKETYIKNVFMTGDLFDFQSRFEVEPEPVLDRYAGKWVPPRMREGGGEA